MFIILYAFEKILISVDLKLQVFENLYDISTRAGINFVRIVFTDISFFHASLIFS